jgi:hypothetical protein
LSISNKSLNVFQVRCTLQRSDVEVQVAWTNLEGLCLFNDLWNPLLRITDKHDN